ncbi:MAG: isochorismatase family cysteine hydrolase [Thermosphaera sp.]
MQPLKPAILVIDMIEEFVRGRLRSARAEQIVPVIANIVSVARRRGIPVIHLIDQHFPFDREFSIWGPHALREHHESKIIDELAPEAGDIVLYKRSYSGFRDTGLAGVLRDLGVDTVILTGIHTHICVMHTAIDAFYERFNIILVSDAISAFSEGDHEYAVEYMKKVLGARLMSSTELVEKLLGDY